MIVQLLSAALIFGAGMLWGWRIGSRLGYEDGLRATKREDG